MSEACSSSGFARWLNATMRSRGLTQAAVARSMGVADAQVSRWRRGQVVPSVRTLQRVAETFGVARTTLDQLAGYPVGPLVYVDDAPADPERDGQLQGYQARFREILERKIPRGMWPAYVDACAALADGLGASLLAVQTRAEHSYGVGRPRDMGFGP